MQQVNASHGLEQLRRKVRGRARARGAEAELPRSLIRGLIALAKARPGKLSFGSSGTGAASHLSAELFKSMAGVDLLHVPYKGTGQALTDLLAGHVDLMFAPAQTVMPHVQSGKLKALGVTGARRAPSLPDLAAVGGSGRPGSQAMARFR